MVESAAIETPEGVVRAYFDALRSPDVDATVALFADDAIVVAPGFDTAAGAAQIRATYEGTFASMRIDEQVEIDGTREAGDLAVVRTHSHGTVTQLESGAASDAGFRELFVLRRASDRWRIAEYMFN
jgi:uncharacterized protein (TIGR02246 family)